MTTEIQVAANRRNALLSTGPQTPEGKAISRTNALKHGLTAQNIDIESERSPAFNKRRDAWFSEYAPTSQIATYALDQAVAASLRMDRCDREFNTLVADHAARAEAVWDIDRREAVVGIGARLARDPLGSTRRLETSRHGCEYLIDRWVQLSEALEKNGTFTEDETSIALDLLGIPTKLRNGCTALDPPSPDDDRAAFLKKFVESEIARLEEFKTDGLDELDTIDRERASRGIGVELTPRCGLLLRYERAAQIHFEKSIKQIGTKPRAATREMTRPAAPRVDQERVPSTALAKPHARLAAAPAKPKPRDLSTDEAMEAWMAEVLAASTKDIKARRESITPPEPAASIT